MIQDELKDLEAELERKLNDLAMSGTEGDVQSFVLALRQYVDTKFDARLGQLKNLMDDAAMSKGFGK